MLDFNEIDLEEIQKMKKNPIFNKYVIGMIEELKNQYIALVLNGTNNETIEAVKERRDIIDTLDYLLKELKSPITLEDKELNIQE